MNACLHALLNMTTEQSCQDQTGKHGISALLEFCEPSPVHELQDMASKVLHNVQRHPANRTRLYRAELRIRRANMPMGMVREVWGPRPRLHTNGGLCAV